MKNIFYTTGKIAKLVGRSRSTIARWEKYGLISRAPRNDRGWRLYSQEDLERIILEVKQTDYFRLDAQEQKQGVTRFFARLNPVSAFVGILVLAMVLNLFGLGQRALFAFTNQTTTVFQTITAGILDIASASSSQSFDSALTVSFTAQTATMTKFGAVRVSDARGSGAGWTLNFSGNDWKADTGDMQLDYDGTGSNDDRGKLCLINTSGAIASAAGQGTTNITRGATDCFSASVTSVDLYTAASDFGKGDYWITDFKLEQYIPANPTPQNLTTTAVLTIN